MHNVLRLAKINSISELQSRANHNARVVAPFNADIERTATNRVLLGSGNPAADITSHLEAHGSPKPRTGKPDKTGRIQSGVIAIEVMVSASPAFFDRPGESAEDRDVRIEKWATVEMAALRKRWGEHLVSAHLHLDEKTPHIHAFTVPLVYKTDGRSKDKRPKWMLSASHLIGGAKSVMTREQDKHYALVAAHFPELNRGKVGSEAVHQTAAEWQAEQHAATIFAADYVRSTEICFNQAYTASAAAGETLEAAARDRQAAADYMKSTEIYLNQTYTASAAASETLKAAKKEPCLSG